MLNSKFFTRSVFKVPILNILSGLLLVFFGIVFIIFRSSVFLNSIFPASLSGFGYAIQEQILSLRIPLYANSLFFILLGFLTIKILKKINFSFSAKKLKIVFFAIIIGLFFVNSFFYFNAKNKMESEMAKIKEDARPANLLITILSVSDCQQCKNMEEFTKQIKKSNIRILGEQTADYRFFLGRNIISKYGIKRVPTVVVSGEIRKNKDIASLFERFGEISKNSDYFVLTKVPPPYVDISTNKMRGDFSLTYITDSSCSSCYDVKLHLIPLSNISMSPFSEKNIDAKSGSGKKLIEKYKIDSIPTIIIDGDLSVYPLFDEIWQNVGSKEKDGSYVFRKVELMGNYKDTKTGKIITRKN